MVERILYGVATELTGILVPPQVSTGCNLRAFHLSKMVLARPAEWFLEKRPGLPLVVFSLRSLLVSICGCDRLRCLVFQSLVGVGPEISWLFPFQMWSPEVLQLH